MREFSGNFLTNIRDKRSLECYVKGSLKSIKKDGKTIYVLKCDRNAEAEVYRSSTMNDAWNNLKSIKAHVLIMAGKDSDTYNNGKLSFQPSFYEFSQKISNK